MKLIISLPLSNFCAFEKNINNNKKIDRAVTSALAEGYTTLREPATLSNNNGKPFNATLQKAIGKVRLRFFDFFLLPSFLKLENDHSLFPLLFSETQFFRKRFNRT